MKKLIIGCASLVLVLSLIIGGCDLFGAEEADDFNAPDMGTASDLPSFGGVEPVDATEAKTIFTDALLLFGNSMPMEASRSMREISTARATTPFSQTINWTGSVGAGTVDVQGTISGSMKSPDEFTPTLNTTYNDIFQMVLNMDIEGTVSGITITDETEEYWVSGKLLSELDLDLNADAIIGSDEATSSANMDIRFAQRAGYALSIKRTSDDKGAKFIISFAHRISKNDIPMGLGSSLDMDSFITELNAKTASLKIYGDDNVLLWEETLPLSEVPGGVLNMLGSPEGAE